MFIKSVSALEEFVAGDSTKIKEVLHPKNDKLDSAYSLAHARLLPGEQSTPHVLQTSSEAYYILNGQGRVYIEEEAAVVAEGDTVLIPAGAKQYIENTGSEELAFLCIVSPPWSADDEIVL